MGFFDAISTCLSKYVTFQGRATRSEYWWWGLFIIIVALGAESVILPHSIQNIAQFKATGVMPPPDAFHSIVSLVYGLFSLATFLPSIAVAVRRFHDLNKSGWWYFFLLVPVIGAIMVLIWFCMRGTRGNNRFGADPLSDF
jgi:uncharacterized membrane protein YhaH (DUF805 family)